MVGTTRDYCRYIEALLIPHLGAITVREVDLRYIGLIKENGGVEYRRVAM